MSRLAEFRLLEQQLAAQLAELEALKNDSALKQEMEFETKLRNLLNDYGYSLRHVIQIIDPQPVDSGSIAQMRISLIVTGHFANNVTGFSTRLRGV